MGPNGPEWSSPMSAESRNQVIDHVRVATRMGDDSHLSDVCRVGLCRLVVMEVVDVIVYDRESWVSGGRSGRGFSIICR